MINLFTPDRELNPPDHPEMIECPECMGDGCVYYDMNDEDCFDYLEKDTCSLCHGEGKIEPYNPNYEWE